MTSMIAVLWCFLVGGALFLAGLFSDFARWGDSRRAQVIERSLYLIVGGAVLAFGVIGLLYPNF